MKKNNLKVTNLKYSYNSKKILKELNLDIDSGKINWIIGNSGSGKSTLIKLLSNLYCADRSSIYINKHDIVDLDPKDVKNNISYTPQESKLFNFSILDNIILNEVYDEELLSIVLDTLHLRSFINKLPDGLDTIYNSDFKNLSGGEIQRICIARSLYKKAILYIFDEPTASLDYASSNYVIEGIRKLLYDKIVLIVTHKFNLIKDDDVIIYIKEGKVLDIELKKYFYNKNKSKMDEDDRMFFGEVYK